MSKSRKKNQTDFDFNFKKRETFGENPGDNFINDFEENLNFENLDSDIQKLPSEESAMLVLPSEVDSLAANHLLVSDGYYKDNTLKILKKDAKTGADYNRYESEEDFSGFSQPEKSYIGRKNSTSWSGSIDDLRQKFGFSWQKFFRKMAIFLLIASILVITGITSVAAIAIDYWNSTPSIDRLERDPNQNSIVYARDGKTKIYEFYKEEKREELEDINEIPLVMQLAVVALEDENYWDADNTTGIPWKNLAGASKECFLTAGGNCRGASGISQQLIKNMTGDDERSPDRKLRELFIAVKLNQGNSKSEILRKYLNWVPFGRNSYGVQEASRAYFGRPINAKNQAGSFVLTAPEACYLAAMIQRPSYYESGIAKISEANKMKNIPTTASREVELDEQGQPVQNPGTEIPASSKDLEFRKDACLTKLHELELPLENGMLGRYIDSKEELEKLKNVGVISAPNMAVAQDAKQKGLVAFVNIPVEDPFPHFREYITKEVTKFISERQLYEEGYEIVTTLDPALQREMEELVKANEPTIRSVGGDNASTVILDGPSGEIMAMVGSLGYDREDIDGKVNIATSPQQPGSSIKPYVYMAAFANGFNPSTVVTDVRTRWQGYEPRNFDGTFRGPVTMRRALQGSLNIPAVKTLFLVNDEPQYNVQSKLDTFFDFTDSLGLVFPCVEGASNILFETKNNGVETCVPSAEKGITQADVDKAYRGRCYIATALGGCELTLVSHASAMNTILQEGNRRTATPFISIRRRSTGEDVYTKIQASNKPVYLTTTADPATAALARQVSNVMADYESRIPEFGNLRFNLELNDKRWRVAAKTGTSNGPRDFWTVGGSPYYTVALWAGKTDNGLMSPNASAGVIIARVWKDIMERLHRDKEPKNFSTEGLQRYFVRTGTSQPDPNNPEAQPKPTGQSELLTEKQIESLSRKSGVVAISNKADLEAVKKQSIIVNRTSLIPGEIVINKYDGLLFVEGQTPQENKQSKVCNFLIPEFPDPNWSTPVMQFIENKPEFCNIPEPSGSTASSSIEITSNLTENAVNSVSEIQVRAGFAQNSSRTVSKMNLFRNGQLIASQNSGFITTSSEPFMSGVSTFTVEVFDNLGQKYLKTISGVQFGDSLEIGAVNCQNLPPGVPTNCNFTIKTSKNLSNVSLRISNGDFTSCAVTGQNNLIVTCNGVPTDQAGSSSGSPVTINIDGVLFHKVIS